MRTNRKRYYARRKQRKRFIFTIGCLCLIVYGSIKLVSFCGDAIRTRQLNKEISREYSRTDQIIDDANDNTSSQDEQLVPSAQLITNDSQNKDNLEAASGDPSLEVVSSTNNGKLLPEYQVIGSSVQESMKKLYKRNNDLRGWLSIKGVCYLPVVYRDNSYYLDHDFDGKKSKAGTLFLDYSHPFKAKTQHLIIHGHDMVDGSMFGLLIHYRNIRYIYEHGIISFNTLFQDERFVIFAVLLVSEDIYSKNYFPYTGTAVFSTEDEFYSFVNQAKNRSLFDIPISVEPGDALLTLSTCLNNDRVLVMFRRIRAGEDEEALSNVLLTSRKI